MAARSLGNRRNVLPVLVVYVAIQALPTLRRQGLGHCVDAVLNDRESPGIEVSQFLAVRASLGSSRGTHILARFIAQRAKAACDLFRDRLKRAEFVGRDPDEFGTGCQNSTALIGTRGNSILSPLRKVLVKEENGLST